MTATKSYKLVRSCFLVSIVFRPLPSPEAQNVEDVYISVSDFTALIII